MEFSNNAVCEKVISNSGLVREALCRSGFYTTYKLNELIELIKSNNEITNGLSSYYIDPNGLFIELRFRTSYTQKNDAMEFYQNSLLLTILYEWYRKYYGEICGIIKDRSLIAYKPEQALMYYYIGKNNNSVIVHFM